MQIQYRVVKNNVRMDVGVNTVCMDGWMDGMGWVLGENVSLVCMGGGRLPIHTPGVVSVCLCVCVCVCVYSLARSSVVHASLVCLRLSS